MFNVKLYNYDGNFQIRMYDIPIDEGKKYNECDVEYNDFTKSDNDTKKNTGNDEHTKKVSVNRSKQKIIEYSRANTWTHFFTFTFAPSEKYNRENYDDCFKILNSWLNRLKTLCPEVAYLCVPEMHDKGGWHFHALMYNVDMELMKFEKTKNFDKEGSKQYHVYNCNLWKKGFSTVTEVRETKGVANYISKYITKSLLSETSGKHRYMASRNLNTAKKISFMIPEDNLEDLRIKYIVDASQKEKCFSKTIQRGAANISYIDFDKEFVDVDKLVKELDDLSYQTGYNT